MTLIGHTIYGDYQGKRNKWATTLTDPTKAKILGEKYELTNVKVYPIHKDDTIGSGIPAEPLAIGDLGGGGQV